MRAPISAVSAAFLLLGRHFCLTPQLWLFCCLVNDADQTVDRIFTVLFLRPEAAGFDGLPTYREPPEGPIAAPQMAKKYPLVFNTGSREPMYVHSRHRNNPRLRELQPNPKLDINPRDAEVRGIKQSDDIIVETPSGAIKVKAHVSNLAQPGVVHMYHGWPQADVNTILARTLDPISGYPAFKSQLCEVRPVNE